jgi:hypothetical protein
MAIARTKEVRCESKREELSVSGLMTGCGETQPSKLIAHKPRNPPNFRLSLWAEACPADEARVCLYGALTLLSATIVRAGEGSAETTECREITARIIEWTNTHFDHFSPSGGSAFFKRPDMVLICDPKFVTYISLNWDASGFPQNDWFALAAAAGNAVTGVDPKILEAATHRCHRAALKDVANWPGSIFTTRRSNARHSPEMAEAL